MSLRVVHQHFGHNDCCEADIHEGQVAEEKVHRGVEPGIRVDGQDDESIPHQGDQVHDGRQQRGVSASGGWKKCPGG